MPRPSMAARRKEEILDAFEECILQGSLEATSLEKLAEQAKMKRSILRHYIGNRDDIIVALSERYLVYYKEQWKQTKEWLPENNRLPVLVDILFGERDQEYVNRSLVGDAIYSQAKRVPALREHQLSNLELSINCISEELKMAYPDAGEHKIKLVARGILAAYMNGESFLPLQLYAEIEELKEMCHLLIETLD